MLFTAPVLVLPQSVTWSDGGHYNGSAVALLPSVQLVGQDIRSVKIHFWNFEASDLLAWQETAGFSAVGTRNGAQYTLRITSTTASDEQWQHFLRLVTYDADGNGPGPMNSDVFRRVTVTATNAAGEATSKQVGLTVDMQMPDIDLPYEGRTIDAILHGNAAYPFPGFGERAFQLSDPESALSVFDVMIGNLEDDQGVYLDEVMAARLGLSVSLSRDTDSDSAYLQITPAQGETMAPDAVMRLLQSMFVTKSNINAQAQNWFTLIVVDNQANADTAEFVLNFAHARQADAAPVLGGVGSVEFHSGSTEAVALIPGLTLSDPDSVLNGALFVLRRWDSDDRLTISAELLNRHGITAGYSTITSHRDGWVDLNLSLGGDASAQAYQEILRSIAFVRGDVITQNAQLRFTLLAIDVSGNDPYADGAINLIAPNPGNRAPVITAPDEGMDYSIQPASDAFYFFVDLGLSDPDSNQSIARAELSFSNFYNRRGMSIGWDERLAEELGITVTWSDATAQNQAMRMTFTKSAGSQATAADFARLISTAHFFGPGNHPETTQHAVGLTVWDDQGASDTARYDLSIGPNYAPVISAPQEDQEVIIEPGQQAHVLFSGLALMDADTHPDQSVDMAMISLSSFQGMTGLWFSWDGVMAQRMGILVSYTPAEQNGGAASLMFQRLHGSDATAADFARLISTAKLSGPGNHLQASHHRVSLTVWDGPGASDSASYDLIIDPEAVASAPIATVRLNIMEQYGGSTPNADGIALFSHRAWVDLDDKNGILSGVTVKLAGAAATDAVNLQAQGLELVRQYDDATDTLTLMLSGRASVEAYEAALASLRLVSSGGRDHVAQLRFSLTVTDGVAQDNAGNVALGLLLGQAGLDQWLT